MKGIEAGVGCGVGIGHGFGVGMIFLFFLNFSLRKVACSGTGENRLDAW